MTITVRKRGKYGKQFIVIAVWARNPLRDLVCGVSVFLVRFGFRKLLNQGVTWCILRKATHYENKNHTIYVIASNKFLLAFNTIDIAYIPLLVSHYPIITILPFSFFMRIKGSSFELHDPAIKQWAVVNKRKKRETNKQEKKKKTAATTTSKQQQQQQKKN